MKGFKETGWDAYTDDAIYKTVWSAAVLANQAMEPEIRSFQFGDLHAKAGADKEESLSMQAAQAQL